MPACLCSHPYSGSNIFDTIFKAVGEGSICFNVTNDEVLVLEDLLMDGGTSFHNVSRTLLDYDIADGGTSFYNTSRTLADYDIADRDL